jgi:predicted nucleic acid-binding Zn ribbon protein
MSVILYSTMNAPHDISERCNNMLNVERALCRDKFVIFFLRIDKFVTENGL